MVPPGHGPHEERSLIAKGVGFSVDPPVMNQTDVADRSPGDQDRDTSHHIIHHLPGPQWPYGVGLALTIYLDTYDQLR